MLLNTPLQRTVSNSRPCVIQDVYRYLNLAGGPGSTLFAGCCEAKDGKETAQVLADDIHNAMLDALGFDSHLAADDDCLQVGKIANMTTDTASVMSSTARILSSSDRLLQGMTWMPCMCHVLNLFVVDQENTFQAKLSLHKAKSSSRYLIP
jgi:hypothetical protein